MTDSMVQARVAFLARVAVFGAVIVMAFAPTRAEEGGSFEALRVKVEQAYADSRVLSRSLLPSRDQLGEGWKLPWDLHDQFTKKANSEDTYWARFLDEAGPIGLDQNDAEQLVNLMSSMFGQQLVAEGGSPSDALKLTLVQLRKGHVPPAQEMLEGFEMSVRGARLAKNVAAQSADNSAGRGELMTRQLFQTVFEGLDDAALRRMAVSEASLVQRRMRMNYFKSNNWQGLIETRMDDEKIKERGLWLMTIDIDLMLLDANPLHWPPDLSPEEIAEMQDRVQAHYLEFVSTYHELETTRIREQAAERRAELERERAKLQQQIAEDSYLAYLDGATTGLAVVDERLAKLGPAVEKKLQKLEQEYAAARNNINIAFTTKAIGDHCQVTRLTGVSPDELQLEASAFSGWLRNGRAVIRVTVEGGNVGEAELTALMDQMLAVMDAKTAHYGGF